MGVRLLLLLALFVHARPCSMFSTVLARARTAHQTTLRHASTDDDRRVTTSPPQTAFDLIVRGEADARVVFEDDELLGIVDRSPASRLHFLILPRRRRVRDATRLRDTAADRALLPRMDGAAREALRAASDGAYDDAEAAIGFHIHPFYSVPSLHLHAIYPRSAILLHTRWKYLPGDWASFRTPTWVAENLPPGTKPAYGDGDGDGEFQEKPAHRAVMKKECNMMMVNFPCEPPPC